MTQDPTSEAAAATIAALTTERDLAREQLRSLVEHTSDALFQLTYRPRRSVLLLGEQLAVMTGRPLEELHAAPEVLRGHVHPDDLHHLSPLDHPGERSTVRTEPYRLLHLDGSVTWVQTSATVDRDASGRVVGLTGAIRDVTLTRRREDALEAALDHERRASEELRRVAELKDALLSAVSHELRTPLTILQGFAELLLTQGHSLPDANRDAAVVAMERNARRLTELLASLLDLDRLGRGATLLERASLPLAEVIDDTLEAMGASTRNLEVAVGELTVHADRSKLERVLENLVANATTHGGPEQPITISAWQEEDGTVIEVADRGPGLPDELHEAVFQPFERGTAGSGVPGTGMGLALVRGFVELHGGRTWVEDRPGGGACFRVWLPDATGAPAPPDPAT